MIRVKKDFLKKYIIGLVVVALLCLGSLYLNKKDAPKETSDTKFYDEYTAYNKKKNSSDKEYIERCQKKIEEFSNQLKVTEFENEVEYNKISNDEIKRRIVADYEGRIDNWN